MTQGNAAVPVYRRGGFPQNGIAPMQFPPAEFQYENETSPGGWKSLDNSTKILIVGGSVVVVGAAVFFGTRAVRKYNARNAERKANYEGNPEYFAQQYGKAFENDLWFGMGTDEEKIFSVTASIPDRTFYNKVAAAYEKLYPKHTLDGDLSDELSSADMDIFHNILNSKPDTKNGTSNVQGKVYGWVQRLNTAYQGFGTNEDEIYNVLYAVPDASAYAMLKQQFAAANNNYTLDEMLNDELSGEDLAKAKQIINSKK